MKIKILECLNGADGFIGGARLASLIGTTRANVNKHIKKMRECGVIIECTRKGYRYAASDTLSEETMTLSLLNRGVNSLAVKIVDCVSTNTSAKELAATGTDFALVMGEAPRGSKGRAGRSFSSEKGGVYMTLIYSPKNVPAADSLKIVLMAALAVNRTLSGYGIESGIKWPNDVMINGKKCTGILVESTLESEYVRHLFVGIGINVNNPLSDELKDIAISMKAAKNNEFMREEVAATVISHLLTIISDYEKNGFVQLMNEYISASCTIGREVTVRNGNNFARGVAVGLDENGFLLLKTDDEIKKIVCGDVQGGYAC